MGMIRQVLFDGKVEVGISEIGDGNMRFFDDGDEADVIENQVRLGKLLDLSGDRIARVRTIYDDRESFTDYYEINENSITEHTITKPETELKLADGLVTKDKNFALLLPLADCLGVVFYDTKQGILGLLHSGRQNLEEDGAFKFVEFLKQDYACKPADLKVYFTAHAQNFEIYALNHAKLAEAAKEQLLRAGVKAENIQGSDIDTVSNPNFPSNSAGDKTTRFAVAVKLC